MNITKTGIELSIAATQAAHNAVRAINAHPWTAATYPHPEDAITEVEILPPNPAHPTDQPVGPISGRISWEAGPEQGFTYRIQLACDGPVMTSERSEDFVLTRAMSWLDLAHRVGRMIEQTEWEAQVDEQRSLEEF